MADPLDTELVSDGAQVFKVDLVAKDGITPTIKEVVAFLQELNTRFLQVGMSADQAFGQVTKKARDLFSQGLMRESLFKNIGLSAEKWRAANGPDNMNAALAHARFAAEKEEKSAAAEKRRYNKYAIESVEDLTLAMGKLAIAAYAVVKPFREVEQFAKQFQRINLQLDMQARGAVTSVKDLTGMGGVLARYGGDEKDAASFKRSFELAMESRRIGKGDGGQFAEALRRYGVGFDPRSFDETMRNIVRWMSSPENRGTVRAQNAGAILGMSPAQIAAAERGLEAWEREAKAMQALMPHREAAAEGAEELAAETAKMNAAWRNLKDGIALDLLPVIKTVTQWLTKAGAALDNDTSRRFIEVVVGLGMLTSVVGGLAKGGKILGGILGVGGAASASAGAAGAAGAAGTAAGIAGGIAKATPLGMAASAIDGVAGAFQRGFMMTDLGMLQAEVQRWHAEWFVHNVAISGRADVLRNGSLLNWARKNNVSDEIVIAGNNMRTFLNKQLEEIRSIQTPNAGILPSGAPSISITGGVTISVQSDSADPVLVAEEVRKTILDEFSVLADNASADVA